jgi:hypothetical protein
LSEELLGQHFQLGELLFDGGAHRSVSALSFGRSRPSFADINPKAMSSVVR